MNTVSSAPVFFLSCVVGVVIRIGVYTLTAHTIHHIPHGKL